MCSHVPRVDSLATKGLLLVLTSLSLMISDSSQSLGFPEQLHEKCFSKSNANQVLFECLDDQRIAIFEAFFTTSHRHRCSSPVSVSTQSSDSVDSSQALIYPRPPLPCTDDLRLSLNRKCSGEAKCNFSLTGDHIPKCIGEDGSVIIKYTCVSAQKLHSFCNLNLSDTYGYVSNPGYPKFYPPYESCVWNIAGGIGQVVVIDLLDISIKEPTAKSSTTRKRPHYQCSDRLVILDDNTKELTLCGEVNSNLVQFRSRSNGLTLEFKAHDFSPTRGLLFRFSLQNCPTIPAPKNGHLIARNASFAYYSCCDDYVFEDSKQVDRVLHCLNGNHWNSSVAKCVALRDLSFTSSLTLSNDTNVMFTQSSDDQTQSNISDIWVPIVLMVALLIANAVIVWVLFRLKRKQTEAKNESNLPLNCRTSLQTNV